MEGEISDKTLLDVDKMLKDNTNNGKEQEVNKNKSDDEEINEDNIDIPEAVSNVFKHMKDQRSKMLSITHRRSLQTKLPWKMSMTSPMIRGK